MKTKTQLPEKPVTAPAQGLLYFALDRSRKEATPARFELVGQALTLIRDKRLRKQFQDWAADLRKAQEALDRYAVSLRESNVKLAPRSVKRQMLDSCFAHMEGSSLSDKYWYVSYVASSLAPHLNDAAYAQNWRRCDQMVRAVEERFNLLLQKLYSPPSAQAR